MPRPEANEKLIFLSNEMFNFGSYRRHDKTAEPVLAEAYFDPIFEKKFVLREFEDKKGFDDSNSRGQCSNVH